MSVCDACIIVVGELEHKYYTYIQWCGFYILQELSPEYNCFAPIARSRQFGEDKADHEGLLIMIMILFISVIIIIMILFIIIIIISILVKTGPTVNAYADTVFIRIPDNLELR